MTEQDGYVPHPKCYATDAIHHGQDPNQWDSKAVITPIVTSTAFRQPGATRDVSKYTYTRWANPTREVLEEVLAKLDNAKYGLAYASGLGAATTVIGLLKSGDHLICGDDVYGGLNSLFSNVATRFGIEVSWVDLRLSSNLEKAIKKNTKLLWIETPTNPTMQVFDLRALTNIAKKNNVISVIDNTLLTSYSLRPLEFGFDIVMYSLTKYINGHTDVLMGALVTSNDELYKQLKFLQLTMGIVPSPFDCYQVIRGIKTLALRMQQHNKNALQLAKYLESHPKIEKVLHPGLPSHPQHKLFKSQTSGHSGTFSFYIKGDLETSKTFLEALKIIYITGSLGGVDSLIEIPILISHGDVPPEQREKLGISDTLIRISVGIEEADDLIADLEQALSKV